MTSFSQTQREHVRHTIGQAPMASVCETAIMSALCAHIASSRITCTPLHCTCKLTSRLAPQLHIDHMLFDPPHAYGDKQLTSQEAHTL